MGNQNMFEYFLKEIAQYFTWGKYFGKLTERAHGLLAGDKVSEVVVSRVTNDMRYQLAFHQNDVERKWVWKVFDLKEVGDAWIIVSCFQMIKTTDSPEDGAEFCARQIGDVIFSANLYLDALRHQNRGDIQSGMETVFRNINRKMHAEKHQQFF